MSVIDAEPLALPASSQPTQEAKLLIQEAKDTLGPAFTRTARKESEHYIQNYTGERLLREEPRRFRLIASMIAENMGIRKICATAHCNARTVASVGRLASASIATQKLRIAGITARVATMAVQRMEDELPTLPPNLLGMYFGIATDKLMIMTGDPNIRIEHNITVNGNIFERINSLAKTIQATVIDHPPQLTDSTP